MDHTLPPLLCRSPLLPGESLPSLLIRLTQANAYHSASMIARLCYERLPYQGSITRPTQSQTYTILADLVRIEAEELYAASVHRLAATVVPPSVSFPTREQGAELIFPVLSNSFLREHTWSETDAQFCPMCLQAAAYHRLTWMPLAVSACLTHRCLLIRGCPHCRTSLTIADILKTQCPACGFDLTTAPTADLSTDEIGLFAQTMIQAWLGVRPLPETALSRSLPCRVPAVLYCVLNGLRKTIMDVKRSWPALHHPPNTVAAQLFPCTSKRDLTPSKAYILYTTAFQGMIDWPRAFYDFLDTYKKRDGRLEQGSVYHDLRYIYVVWLKKAWQHSEFRFVREAFDRYFLEHYYPDVSLRFGQNLEQAKTEEVLRV